MDLNDRAGMLSEASALLEEGWAAAETEAERERIGEAASEAIIGPLESAGAGFAQSLRDRAPKMLREHRRMRQRLERNLKRLWGKALNAYYAVNVVALEAGELFPRASL